MSCDHRVIDGALGAGISKGVRHLLENPALLMVLNYRGGSQIMKSSSVWRALSVTNSSRLHHRRSRGPALRPDQIEGSIR